MNADNPGEPGREQHKQKRQGDHALGWAILDAAIASEYPQEAWSDGVDQEQTPADTAEEDI